MLRRFVVLSDIPKMLEDSVCLPALPELGFTALAINCTVLFRMLQGPGEGNQLEGKSSGKKVNKTPKFLSLVLL